MMTQTSLRLRLKDSPTKRCRLKPVVLNSQAAEKREEHFNIAGVTGSNRTLFAVPCLQLCFFVAKRIALLLWAAFKAFLQKSQDDLRVFVYITWSRIRQDSEYQQEEVLHWASHFEHPQSIEFDADSAPEKPDLN